MTNDGLDNVPLDAKQKRVDDARRKKGRHDACGAESEDAMTRGERRSRESPRAGLPITERSEVGSARASRTFVDGQGPLPLDGLLETVDGTAKAPRAFRLKANLGAAEGRFAGGP